MLNVVKLLANASDVDTFSLIFVTFKTLEPNLKLLIVITCGDLFSLNATLNLNVRYIKATPRTR